MEMCARCHKRVAVVFITRLENGETKNEGICLKCARELGIKPIDDILKKMGITNEEFDQMADSAEDFMQGMVPNEDGENPEDGGAPAVDFGKLMRESRSKPNSAATASVLPSPKMSMCLPQSGHST